MKRFNEILIVALILAVLLGVPILTKLEEPKDYSPFENRNLAAAPVFSQEALWSGSYFSQWETYLSDHIYKRDVWLENYVAFQMNFLRRPVINQVYLGETFLLPYNKYYMLTNDYPGKAKTMAEDLHSLNREIESYGGTFLYVGVPEQYSILRDEYPFYLYNNQEHLEQTEAAFFNAMENKGVPYLNMRELFLKERDYKSFYFKTDHHYNLKGAYFTYQKVMERLNEEGRSLPVLTEDAFTFKDIDREFYGSRGRKLYRQSPVSDRLTIYEAQQSIPFQRWDNGQPSQSFIFKMPEGKDEPVEYTLYMGGDMAETIIRTERPNLPNLLIFGDSFTNALETFTYCSFNETRSVDLRHYTEKSIADYIREYRPDVVLCVRDDTSYLSDTGNGKLN